jgi:WD40 repeat protein
MPVPTYPLRRVLTVLLITISLGLLLPSTLIAQRRGRTSPGLVLETGARHATCDMLAFTPDGSELMAVGDDKVVRIWSVGANRFVNHRSRTLRWPIYREQRGGVFTMCLSPDASRLVVGGFGILTGYLAVLDRATGDIVNALESPPVGEVTWATAFSPSGKYVVYGTENGKLFRWDVGADAKKSVRFADSGGPEVNRVRLIAFVDGSHFISVAQDGIVREWDVTNPKQPAREMEAFRLPDLFRVVMSRDRRWLAACGESLTSETEASAFELIDLKKLRARMPEKEYLHRILFPQEKAGGNKRYTRAVAFDHAGERLAVGVQVVPQLQDGGVPFARITGGVVHVFDVVSGKRLTERPLDLGYRVEYMAFRPGYKNQIATAGGNNHEVRLWDLTRPANPQDEIRSPGSCLWGVAMSGKDYLAWKEQRSPNPKTPNDWGAGPWRILDLNKRKIITGKPPPDFKPVKSINRIGPWRVQTTQNSFVWRVVGPEGTNVALDWSRPNFLYRREVNQIPRCYTFLPPTDKTKVPRLAVGHQWGVSLYELRPNDVRLVRLLVGHESEVMAVAPSEDGRLLVTASRDETLAGWSLENWPAQRELGASFVETADGKIEVRNVAPGSPAWEAGLTPGDEIIMVVSSDRDALRGFLYDPLKRGLKRYGFTMEVRQRCSNAQILEKLRNVEPGREYIFVWRHEVNGKMQEKKQLTTVRQRPLWRFFPTHSESGNDWVIWRWRDFYYDTSSPVADRLVGWHVNAEDLRTKPKFHPLEYFRGTDEIRGPKGQALGFHRPEKIWSKKDGAVAGALINPDKVIFPDIEPPDVQVRVVQNPGKNTDLIFDVTIKPLSANLKQKLNRVTLWLDDYRSPDPPAIKPKSMEVDGVKVDAVREPRFVIKRANLRRGLNQITVQCYNDQGGRGQATVNVDFDDGIKAQRNLHALCVGINNYSKVRGWEFENLNFSRPDAEEMDRVFRQHKGCALYRAADVAKPLLDGKATAKEIVARLKAFKNVKRDDWFILFLSGHGHAKENAQGYEPGSFFYVCTDSNRNSPTSVLTSKQLYDILAAIPCRKLVILDTCHSGAVDSNPLRDLMRDGVPFLIFSSCDPKQSSLEPFVDKGEVKGRLRHGFFTESILETIQSSAAAGGRNRMQLVTAHDLAVSIRKRLKAILVEYKQEEDAQTPVFLPERLPDLEVLCRP